MINDLIDSVLGGKEVEGEKPNNKLLILIVIGIVLFLLLGGRKLFQKPEDEVCDSMFT